MNKRILLVLGGTWHKFNEFSADIGGMLIQRGYAVEPTYDLSLLSHLPESRYDLVIMYTCLSITTEDGTPAKVLMTDAIAEPLRQWVAAGGSLLMIHSATVACQTSEVLRKLAGGVFLEHPPAMNFLVRPLSTDHPITAGIPPFTVFDEFYIQRTEPDVNVLMVATYQDETHSMVWTRQEHNGRIAYIATGHDEQVWQLPPYRNLLAQAVRWLIGPCNKRHFPTHCAADL